jgi:peptide/nickel transport system substrate-binding protein
MKSKRKVFTAIFAVGLAAGAVAGCSGGGGTGGGASAQDLTVGWASPPDTLNPATTGARSVGPLVATMFETLVYLKPDGKATPGLATQWKVTPDGKTYTFTLRQNVKFHDNTPFNADAVVANLNYITDKTTQSTIALGLLGPCTHAKAESQYVVSLSCTKPYAPLISQLGEPYLGIQSPTAIKKYGKDLGQHPTGTGPFAFVSYAPNQRLVVKRNPGYQWAPSAVGSNGPAKLSQITFQFIPNDQSRVGALQSRQAQLIQVTPGVFYKRLKGSFSQSPNPISGMGVFAPINASRWPTNDPAVRKAIMYALDRQSMIQFAAAGVYPPNESPLVKGMFGHDDSLASEYSHDPQKAQQALQQGGWTKQGDGSWTKGGKKLSLTITAINTSPTYPLLAQAMQGNLKQVGIEASVQQMGDSAWVDNNVKGGFNLTPLTYVAVDPDALSLWFNPGSFYNWSHYTNDRLTSLLAQGRVTADVAQRAAIYKQAQQIIMDQAVLYPIYENQDLLTYSKKLTGMSYSGGGFESFYGATLKK